MTLDFEGFSRACNRYALPSADEYWLEDILRENSIPFAAVELVGLLWRFNGPTSEINSYVVADKGAALLRPGQGMNEFVVLPGKKPELLAALAGQQSDCSTESYSLRRMLRESNESLPRE